jgi:hypothetical protein
VAVDGVDGVCVAVDMLVGVAVAVFVTGMLHGSTRFDWVMSLFLPRHSPHAEPDGTDANGKDAASAPPSIIQVRVLLSNIGEAIHIDTALSVCVDSDIDAPCTVIGKVSKR